MIDLDTIEEYARDSEENFNEVEMRRYNNRVEVYVKPTNTTFDMRVDDDDNAVLVNVEESGHIRDSLVFNSEGYLEDFLLNEIQQYI